MKAVTGMNWGRLPGVIAALALLLNLVLPAFHGQAEAYAAPFDDVVICSAHQLDDAPAPERAAAKLCAMCLMLGHHGAFAPSQQPASAPSLAAVAAPPSVFAGAGLPAGIADRPFAPRAPPAL